MPFDKFGWFYGRNGSKDYDGKYEMYTGKNDIGQLGTIKAWNNKTNLTEYYPGHCGQLSGSAGEFFPPNRDKTSLSYFSSDICRTIFFNFKEETEREGVKGYKYWLDMGFMGNATTNASNECYNPHPDLVQQPKDKTTGEDLPNVKPLDGSIDLPLWDGLLNVTSCKFNAPAYVSFPHFFMADPKLLEAFDPQSDLWPNEEQHSCYITLMPEPAIPLDVSIRLQINMLLRPLELIPLMENLDTIVYPMLWFESYTDLDSKMVSQLKLLEWAPKIGNISGGISLGIGLVLSTLGGFLLFRQRSSGTLA